MTCAIGVVAILLPNRVEHPEAEVGVQDVKITSTPTSTGRIEVVEMALAVMKGDHDTDITGKDDSDINHTLCIA